jgi:hypothetical protein
MADHELRADGDQADRGEIADRIIGDGKIDIAAVCAIMTV